MFMVDRLTLGTPRRTKEGYLAVRAKAARAGVYDYLGREVDPEGKHFKADEIVKVYRPESEVFSKDAVHSFLLKPITDDHPTVAVTADNWRQHAKGVNAGALRDGDYLAFDLVLMDTGAIQAVDSGKRELSNGYGCELDIGDGVAPDGTAYQATQRNINGNHIAIVQAGRAGPECRIGDVALCDALSIADILDRRKTDDGNAIVSDGSGQTGQSNPGGDTKMPHVLIIDGLQVPNVSDEAKAAIEKLQGQIGVLTVAKDTADKQVGELTATIQTKDGEIAGLNVKLKDAEVTPAKLQLLADARAKVIAGAQMLKPSIVVDGRTDSEIRKEAVEARLGDSAKDMSDAAIEGAFAALSKDAKPGVVTDSLRTALTGGITQVADAGAVRDLARAMQYN